jgi:hypothetical protein
LGDKQLLAAKKEQKVILAHFQPLADQLLETFLIHF